MLSVGYGCTYCPTISRFPVWIPSSSREGIVNFASSIGIDGSYCLGKHGKAVVLFTVDDC